MRISRIKIGNFRGVKSAELLFPQYAALVGDNNCGKSTVLEAIDLCLGPERLNKILFGFSKPRVLDPACGLCGMFVQLARFVSEHKENPGVEKTDETKRLIRLPERRF